MPIRVSPKTPRSKTPPGPPRWQATQIMNDFRKDPLRMIQKMAQVHGNKAFYHMGPQPILLLSDPELIRNVLTRDNAHFKKGRLLEIAKDLLGNGLLTAEGELHDRQRRLIQPMFHRQMIQAYGTQMVAYGERFRTRWQDGESLDMASEMMRLTLAIVGQTLFAADVENKAPHVGEALSEVLEVFNVLGNPIAMMTRNWPTPRRKRMLKAKGILDETIANIIAERRRSDSEAHDLITLLLHLREDNQQAMSDPQIRDEAMTLFLAGHETTANALTWTWYLLSQHPRVEARLHRELDEVLGGRLPEVEDLNHLKYTRLILTEAMRLYPPAWAIARKAIQAYELNADYTLPAGTIIMMSQYLIHRSERYYDEPERFWPERWEGDLKQRNPKFAYFPFGGGPRNCIGEAFAWMEGILLIATLAQRWRFQLEPGQKIALLPRITLRPRDGLKMRLQAR